MSDIYRWACLKNQQVFVCLCALEVHPGNVKKQQQKTNLNFALQANNIFLIVNFFFFSLTFCCQTQLTDIRTGPELMKGNFEVKSWFSQDDIPHECRFSNLLKMFRHCLLKWCKCLVRKVSHLPTYLFERSLSLKLCLGDVGNRNLPETLVCSTSAERWWWCFGKRWMSEF